jgi:hypothetical protein
MDIGGWLRGLGLGQYEATFRESEIDAEVLPELTESDLSQLGVPLGHRKRLLKAIAAYRRPTPHVSDVPSFSTIHFGPGRSPFFGRTSIIT